MTAKREPADENLLRAIAEKEKELETKVTRAREQARRLVEDARRQAEAIQEQARREAAALVEQTHGAIAQEEEEIVTRRVASAQVEADQIRARAAERIAEAVEIVVQRVLGGLEQAQSPAPGRRSKTNEDR